MEAISKIDSMEDTIIHIREPETRPLTTSFEMEKDIAIEYYTQLTKDEEVKGKISKIVRKIRTDHISECIEEIAGLMGLEKVYIKIRVRDSKINATAMIPRIESKNILHKLMVYIEVMLEDLALSLGLSVGSITIMTMKIG
ncbi:MAG: hypothetical protein NDF57_03580 [archaeon GBS-70-058]|nr:hypothetical protein [Candidatus Culexarchaeum nevadense]